MTRRPTPPTVPVRPSDIRTTRSHPYICGHCAVGQHQRCPRFVAVGNNVDTGPTSCHCTNKQHADAAPLF